MISKGNSQPGSLDPAQRHRDQGVMTRCRRSVGCRAQSGLQQLDAGAVLGELISPIKAPIRAGWSGVGRPSF
jgi:hypothetical protein